MSSVVPGIPGDHRRVRSPVSIDQSDSDTGERLVTVIRAIPNERYGAWWGTDDGIWLHAAIRDRIGPTVVGYVHSLYGVEYEALDVAQTAVSLLESATVRERIASANNPWAYLYVSLQRKMISSGGAYFRAQMTSLLTVPVAASGGESNTPSMLDAVQETVNRLKPVTPASLHGALTEGVFYFAERGHSRLSHLFTQSTRDVDLLELGFNRDQILALANVVLGARADHGRTSLLAGFLSGEDWSPDGSTTHQRALDKYRTRMLRNVQPTLTRKAA